MESKPRVSENCSEFVKLEKTEPFFVCIVGVHLRLRREEMRNSRRNLDITPTSYKY